MENNTDGAPHFDSRIATAVISAYVVVTFIGWFGNVNVVIATVYNRSLQQPCHILIAIQSFFEIFHQAAHPITAYFIYTGNYFIAVRECLYLQFVSNISMQLAAFLILSIGVDRIFCVCFSICYNNMNKTHYIIAMMIPAALYSIMQLVVAYISDQTDLEVVCTVAAIYTDDSQLVFAVGGCLLNMIVIVVYVLMWIIVRKKASASSAKKLIKTLIIIVTCVVFGYYATMLVFLVIVVLDLDPVSSFYAIMGGGMFVNASVSCNFFVLYWLW
uniref:G-protein coupled receptors family 1 profile domain-containing protein n=1 Tax=Parascaris univalens TaxID=6257 RepID=A0A915BF26_PARUN